MVVLNKRRVIAYSGITRLTCEVSMNWELFFSIYFIIFIAELPDKTAFATLLLATRSRGLAVFSGVALAFLVQTIVACIFGQFISILPEKWVHLLAGILFLYFAFQMWRDRNEIENNSDGTCEIFPNFWVASWKAFMVIFIAEWGDLTQIATASLIAKYQNEKLTVFLAAVLALWSVTLVAIFLGQHMKKLINPKILRMACAALFLIIGIYFIIAAVIHQRYL